MQPTSYSQSQFAATALDQTALASIKSGHPAAAALAGAGAYVALGSAISERGIGIANANWNVISTISGCCIGGAVYGEPFSDRVLVGIVLGILSLYLMSAPPPPKM